MVKPSQEDEFWYDYEFFFRDSCYFPYIKTILKVSNHVFEKNSTLVNNLNINCFQNRTTGKRKHGFIIENK